MKTRWTARKAEAVRLRKLGTSMTVIERELGIARSTLSGWFKNIKLTREQRAALQRNSRNGWENARPKAVAWHHAQKAQRLITAKLDAMHTLSQIEITPEVIELAFSMLYLGEGAKDGSTALASSNPTILRFMLRVLYKNFSITPSTVRCDLHLRMDQDEETLKRYWAMELSLPLECFKYAAFDRRSEGKPTYPTYKGVCVVSCGRIDIQRKLMYLYTLFCERVVGQRTGV